MGECRESENSALKCSTACLGIAEYRNDGNEGNFTGWAIRGVSKGPDLQLGRKRFQRKPIWYLKQVMSRATAPPQFLSLAIPYTLRQCPGRTGGTASPEIRNISRLNRKWLKEDNDGLNDAMATTSIAGEQVLGKAENAKPQFVCSELVKGRKRTYRMKLGDHAKGFETEEEKESRGQKVKAIFAGYLLPQGYPESVAPQYFDYMRWRGVQYLFGGAISVFTTRSLLTSLGVGGKHAGESAAAINWVLKDGAGRLGRFLFARWGRALDCELKQFRLLGDLLMESGAALELCTMNLPGFFLPLACTANLSKNLAAVAASSTRAPIYRTFALQNNLADVTAKGESVANLADILGTTMGILLSRMNLPLRPTFCVLSAGYLVASRKEVDAVELPYFNRARLALATRKFFQSGIVPGIAEANHSESLVPWGKDTGSRIVLGANVGEAFNSPEDFAAANQMFSGKPYLISYRPSTKKVYAVLREGVSLNDILEASFHAHFFLRIYEEHAKNPSQPLNSHVSVPKIQNENLSRAARRSKHKRKDTMMDASELLTESTGILNATYQEFRTQSESLGWKLHSTMLNPRESRLLPS